MACGNGQKTPSRAITAWSEMPPPRIELGPAAPEAVFSLALSLAGTQTFRFISEVPYGLQTLDEKTTISAVFNLFQSSTSTRTGTGRRRIEDVHGSLAVPRR
jgi:hypothetical protein